MNTPEPELFPELPESLSPMLRWVRENGARTQYTAISPEPWRAWLPDSATPPGMPPEDPDSCGYGQTAEEALTELSSLAGIKHWSESQP